MRGAGYRCLRKTPSRAPLAPTSLGRRARSVRRSRLRFSCRIWPTSRALRARPDAGASGRFVMGNRPTSLPVRRLPRVPINAANAAILLPQAELLALRQFSLYRTAAAGRLGPSAGAIAGTGDAPELTECLEISRANCVTFRVLPALKCQTPRSQLPLLALRAHSAERQVPVRKTVGICGSEKLRSD